MGDIELDIPFKYNNSENLIIAVDDNRLDSHYGANYFYSSQAAADMSIGCEASFDDINPGAPGEEILSAFRTNIRIQFAEHTNAPIIELGSKLHDFGSQGLNEVASFELTITNNGLSDLVINGANVAEPFFCDYSGTIAPGQSKSVTIVYMPGTVVDFSEMLTFNIDGECYGNKDY